MYWVRLVGGVMFLAGTVMLGINMIMTIRKAPKHLPDPAFSVASN
jgi:cbb3-type cytochrome oxidase subunit 1